MRLPSFRSLILLPALFLAACNHSDITGPNDGAYVHVIVANDSSASIWAPVSKDRPGEILPGSQAELFFIQAESMGGGFAVARPEANNLAIVYFSFVRPPARMAGLQYATLHVTANPSAPVTASCDRTDLVLVTGVTQQ